MDDLGRKGQQPSQLAVEQVRERPVCAEWYRVVQSNSVCTQYSVHTYVPPASLQFHPMRIKLNVYVHTRKVGHIVGNTMHVTVLLYSV